MNKWIQALKELVEKERKRSPLRFWVSIIFAALCGLYVALTR